jgi:hypothetical protein
VLVFLWVDGSVELTVSKLVAKKVVLMVDQLDGFSVALLVVKTVDDLVASSVCALAAWTVVRMDHLMVASLEKL